MFQKGTGERFKYKQAVIEKFPNAFCMRTAIKNYLGNTTSSYLYVVMCDGKRMSEAFRTAEGAWADCWVNRVK